MSIKSERSAAIAHANLEQLARKLARVLVRATNGSIGITREEEAVINEARIAGLLDDKS